MPHPYESRADAIFRRDVLANFECPFVESGICWNMHQSNPRTCWFAHPNGDRHQDRDHRPTAPRPVPFYACVYHMTNHCRHTKPDESVATHEQICPNGMHLSVAEFASLDEFEVEHFEKIRAFVGEDGLHECGICLEVVLNKRLSREREFALLENCSHIFCASCLSKENRRQGHQPNDHHLDCPLCRVPSRFIRWPTFVLDPEAKRLIFLGY